MPSYSEMLLGTGEEQAAEPSSVPTSVPPTMGPAPARKTGESGPSYSDMLLGTVPPAPENITPQSTYEGSAALSDIAVASLANDPQAQARYFAEQRGLPLDRYRIYEGRVIYQDDEGKWNFEQPNAILADPRTWMQSAARGVGPAMPVTAGTAAGILTAPMHMAGPAGTAASIGLTGAAGAGGQALREVLAQQVTGQEISPGRIAQEGAFEGLGQGVGLGAASYAQRHVTRDIGRLSRPEADRLAGQAASRNIQLTPAEITNLPSLKAQQKALGNLPESADVMGDFYQRRASQQIAPAVERELARISPVEGAELAGELGRRGATRSMEGVAAERAARASPLYMKAFAAPAPADVVPVLSSLRTTLKKYPQDGEVARQLRHVLKLLTREVKVKGGVARTAETGLEQLHHAKLEIDQLLDRASTRTDSLGRVTKREVARLKDQLLGAMDAASPDYAAARKIFADMSPGVERVREGVVGMIADLPDSQARLAAAKLFAPGSSGPRAVSEAKGLLQKAAPDAWQALKRSWLEEQWLKAGKETLEGGPRVNQGALWRKALVGDPKQREILRAALDPSEFRAIGDLADVLEAAGRVKPIGSDTAWNQEMMKVMRQEGTPAWIRGMRYFTLDMAKEASDRLTEWSLRRNSAEMARVITEPGGMEKLRQLRVLKAPAVIKRALLGHLFVRGGEAALSGDGQSGPAQ